MHGALCDLHAALPGGLVVRSTASSPAYPYREQPRRTAGSDCGSPVATALAAAAAECAAAVCVAPEDDVTHDARQVKRCLPLKDENGSVRTRVPARETPRRAPTPPFFCLWPQAMQAACAALAGGAHGPIAVRRWSPGLRPAAPWEPPSLGARGGLEAPCFLPTTHAVYEAAAKATPLATPRAPAQGSEEEESLAARLAAGAALLPGSPLPPLGEFLARAAACTPPAVRASLFLGNVCPPSSSSFHGGVSTRCGRRGAASTRSRRSRTALCTPCGPRAPRAPTPASPNTSRLAAATSQKNTLAWGKKKKG